MMKKSLNLETTQVPPLEAVSDGSSLRTGFWLLGAVGIYYAIQVWLLPSAGVQT